MVEAFQARSLRAPESVIVSTMTCPRTDGLSVKGTHVQPG